MPTRLPLVAPLLLAFILVGPNRAAVAAEPLPNSMAALGDSITRSFNAGLFLYADNPQNSWSTGFGPSVLSHYRRILAANPASLGQNYNDAVSGAKMADLADQVAAANAQKVEYVTILIGGNDLCASSESAMTPVATFRAQFQSAMDSLKAGSPNANVLVVSIPDVHRLWEVLKDNARARFVWAAFRICQSMLARPRSTAPTDLERRARVRQRNIDFNQQLSEVCAAYGSNCLYDRDAVFNTRFVASDVSTRDYFHPSIAGQNKLASISWSAGFWGP